MHEQLSKLINKLIVICQPHLSGARCEGDGAALQDRPAQLCRIHPGAEAAQGQHQGSVPEARSRGHCELGVHSPESCRPTIG